MRYNDLRSGLDEYHRLPDDLTARINFDPPPAVPRICTECGQGYGESVFTWDDIQRELELGHGDKEYQINGLCPLHSLGGDDDEEEEGNDDD